MPLRPFPELGRKRKTVPNSAAPKRDAKAPPPAEPDPEVPRADGDSYVQGDVDAPRRFTLTSPASYLITVTQGPSKRAGDEPARGWTAYPVLSPDGNPTGVIRDPVFAPENFLNLEAPHGWVTGETMGPLTPALKAARAVKVDPGEFRTLDEKANLLRPLMGRGFHLWKLQDRHARKGKASHEWRLAARLGPSASGAYSIRVFDLDATPPGIRRAGFREVLEFLRPPGQVGYPPNVATDAQSGFSVMAYQ